MGVILAENVRDVGYASGKISWRTLRHPENGKRLGNEFLVLQTHKSVYNPVAALSSLSRANKQHRILLSNTKDIIKREDGQTQNLIGKTLIIAESDSQDEIVSAWHALEDILFPTLAMISQSREDRRITWNEFIETLTLIEDKRAATLRKLKVQITKQDGGGAESPRTPTGLAPLGPKTPTTPTRVNVNVFEPVTPVPAKEEPIPDEPPVKVNKVVPKQRVEKVIAVTNIDAAADAIREYAQILNSLKDNVKKLGTPRHTPKITETIESLLEKIREYGSQFERYVSRNSIDTKSKAQPTEEQQRCAKLNLQYQELKEILKTQIVANVHVQQIEAAGRKKLEEKQKREAEEKKQKELEKIRQQEEEEERRIELAKSQNQQQLMKQTKKIHVTQAAKYTAHVEQEVANETKKDLLGLESEMNQLHQIHKDLNYLIKDQDDMIHEIMDNAEYADNNILKGTENIRDAKKLRTLGLF